MPYAKGQSGNLRGRPPKAEKYERQIGKAEKRVADKLPWLIDKEFELAEGVTIQQETPEGPLIYERPPDRQAIEYLLNRIMGKPTERQEVEQSGDVTIRVEYAEPLADLDAPEAAPGPAHPLT